MLNMTKTTTLVSQNPSEIVNDRRKVAFAILELRPPEVMARRLDMISRGIDPDAKPGAGHEPISWDLRWKAEMHLMDRALGKVSERVHFDGEVRTHVSGHVALHVIDPRDLLRELGPDGAAQYQDFQRKVVRAARAKLDAVTARRQEREERFLPPGED